MRGRIVRVAGRNRSGGRFGSRSRRNRPRRCLAVVVVSLQTCERRGWEDGGVRKRTPSLEGGAMKLVAVGSVLGGAALLCMGAANAEANGADPVPSPEAALVSLSKRAADTSPDFASPDHRLGQSFCAKGRGGGRRGGGGRGRGGEDPPPPPPRGGGGGGGGGG